LKKFASHFFNHAFGVTGEKEAANPVTGKKYNQVFNGSNSFRLLLLASNTFCNCKGISVFIIFWQVIDRIFLSKNFADCAL
jgi:hypothetical protein